MRRILLAASLACLLPQPAFAATRTSTDSPAPANPAVDKLVDEFFAMLKAGNVQGGVKILGGNSPLMAGRDAEMMNLGNQIENGLRIYGPVLSIEKVDESVLGTSYVKRYYIVRHEKMLTRWEFEFGRLKAGWGFVYFGFEDQVRTWQ